MKIVGMIPARMGSKRIKLKNIRYLDNKPLIQYAIDLAKASNKFTEIYVNSESAILEKFAFQHGTKFHRRPDSLSTDTSTNQDFTREFLEKHECDYVIMINSTSPLLRLETLEQFIDFVQKNKFDTVLSVVDEYAECFYNGETLNFTTAEKINSQNLTPVRKVVWAITAWKRDSFLKACETGCGVFNGSIGCFPIPKDECCDLDTLEDWAIAEGMLEARKKRSEAEYWHE